MEEFAAQLPRAARDDLLRWAAECEGREVHSAANEGPVVQMLRRESDTLSSVNTAIVAGLALQLHQEYDFTDACATDGSFLDGEPGLRSSRAAFGVWHASRHGVTSYGGSLPTDSTIQDAEMAAIVACLRRASRPSPPQEGEGAQLPRLLVIGDSASVLQAIESAWRGGSEWQLRLHNQNSDPEG